MRKTLSLVMMVGACLWFAVRDFVSLPAYDDEGFESAMAMASLGPDKAIENLSQTIDQQVAAGVSPETLAQTYRLRGSYRLQRHEPREACADFDEALRLNPGETTARFGRAECFRQLGDPVRANAEIQQTNPLELSDAFPGLKGFAAGSAGLVAFTSTATGTWLVVAAVWALLTLINVAAGRAQTAVAAASFVRLLGVAGALGLVECLPLAIWATLATCGASAQVNGWLAAGATFVCLMATIPMLQPPIRMRAKGASLPRVEDREFLKRVAELAERMHVPVPVVRLWPSITGSQHALAFAGTIQAPQLVVTDGILTRLAPLERDAVVAHELGHIANGSLWLFTSVVPVSCAIATAVSAWFDMSIAVPFGLALGMGLRRIVSRPLELDADRRAARAIGFRETTAALTKIHAVHALGDNGLLRLLAYATATHPSPEVRLWSLSVAAPQPDDCQTEPCLRTIRRHRIAAVAAFALWLLILAGTLAAAAWAPQIPIPAFGLWIVAFLPTALVAIAQRRQVSIANRRLGRRPLRAVGAAIALLACPVLGFFPEQAEFLLSRLGGFNNPEYFLILPLFLAGVGLLSIFWLNRAQEVQKLRSAIVVAYQIHDFQRVLEIGRMAPAVVARDPLSRYHLAFARALGGDRPAAIAELHRLWQEHPGLPVTAFTLCSLLLDADLAEQALAVAQEVARRLPDDAATHVLVARSLRRLGRTEESREACQRALLVEPRSGYAHAVAAAIDLDEGDLFQARQSIATALEFSPGEPYVMLVRAEISLETQPFDNPRVAVEEALAVIRANPFAFFRADVMRLEQALAELERPSPVLETAAAWGATIADTCPLQAQPELPV